MYKILFGKRKPKIMFFVHEMQTSIACLPLPRSRAAECRAGTAFVPCHRGDWITPAFAWGHGRTGQKNIQPRALWLWGWMMSACG